MSHKELLRSEWVENDVLTVRLDLEVRAAINVNAIRGLPVEAQNIIDVPAATMCSDFLMLLDSGRFSDVTFLIDGEAIRAHSLVLSARSEVFGKILHGGMCESVSKEVKIEDVAAPAFKALLRFLYSDDFGRVEEVLRQDASGSSNSVCCSAPLLQNLLAASHRYCVGRLQAWCERKLCGRIDVSNVCSTLCQAHLYEASQLEAACLKFISSNHCDVVVTEDFGKLCSEWPEVALKVSLHASGVPRAKAQLAVEASKKRKREE